ncbi:cyclopropane-fatty-acyl-phospholipid synthase [Nemania sp. NC0429]|nr:cyclopropane-fatty-acyl-phospholipid synthase [Nemania sp. NC0429]
MAPSRPSLSRFLSRPLYNGTALLRRTLGGLTWGPTLAVAKSAILSVFSTVEEGTLVLIDEPSGQHHVFGQPLPSGKPDPNLANDRVFLIVKNEAFWMHLFLCVDMGFAEAYMLGEVECEDLAAFFRLFIVNRERMGNGTTLASSLFSLVAGFTRSTNTISNSLLNVSAHYDISNDIFAAFLSPDMTYSCPVWVMPAAPEEDEDLENAQMTKLHRFIDGARIKATDHVLEIGTGWGSFAIEAVRTTGCRVTTLTLSREQKALAEERIAQAGLSDRIQVQLMDYRALPVPETLYDNIVSIEMVEAVGKDHLGTYFACVDRLLKKKGGIAMFQSSTLAEGRYDAYSAGEDFINHYMFPGAHLPTITSLTQHISTQSRGTLVVERIENIGGHYVKCLRLWKENFLANFDSKIRPALKREHGHMTEEEVNVFRRKWEYYFTYSEAGFITKTLGDAIITVGMEGSLELMEGIPL